MVPPPLVRHTVVLTRLVAMGENAVKGCFA
jgi:hypothetical protein